MLPEESVRCLLASDFVHFPPQTESTHVGETFAKGFNAGRLECSGSKRRLAFQTVPLFEQGFFERFAAMPKRGRADEAIVQVAGVLPMHASAVKWQLVHREAEGKSS